MERPASTGSSHTGAVIENARVRLREGVEEDSNKPGNPKSTTSTEIADDEVTKNSSSNPISDNKEDIIIKDKDASNPKSKSQMYQLQGDAPKTETKIPDIVNEIPETVISRPGTPGTWAFDDKDPSLHTKPPRPSSASLCSPPIPRKTPVSVDHHLRK